ncbi:glycosyltransferase family 4 protein [Paenibacillus sp. PAMC21692]|uniref:glycosyltransferase family 4 protein n=1 Tax=Paenibacillus sp. PAMC21692 TaxID=2762320 RepID=UPI00164D66E6|nr:glycosyltransferase family 4 protein [Paenibacillus sp. PAMC21692]QNK55275.1 glycosyltransferase [Paenibacillus sp. PAMC21692]
MNILVVCSDFPYPADHGGRVDTWGRIRALAGLGWGIDLLVCGKHEPAGSDLRAARAWVNDIKLCDRKSSPLDILMPEPLQVRSRNALRTVPIDGDYDYVLLEGDYVYPVLDNPGIRAEQAILRVHNDESAYFKSLARSTGQILHKLYYAMESLKFAGLQKKLQKRVTKYLFISSKEYDSFVTRHPQAESLFLPPPLTRESFARSRFDTKHVVFIGSLFMPNNREAIRWYLDQVHPKLLDIPGYRFVIAGNSRGMGVEWLNSQRLEGVYVHDTPANLDEIYAKGYLFVNPMRNGAGVKLKTIEAIQNGLPVVSTTVGSEGTGLRNGLHIRVEDEPAAFCRAVRELLSEPAAADSLLQASQQFIRERYNHKETLKTYFRYLERTYSPERGISDVKSAHQHSVRDARG